MSSGRLIVAFVLAPLLVASWITVAASDAGRAGPTRPLIFPIVFGTIIGQTTLAAAWTALGPLPLFRRLWLSLAWIAALAIAFGLHIKLHLFGPNTDLLVVIVCSAMGGIWVLVQIPLWCLAGIYGIRLRHLTDPPASARDRQFGITQLLLLTLSVAIVLGILRWIAGEAAARAPVSAPGQWQGLAFFVFLTGTGIVMLLPLLLAALLPRFSGWAVAVVLTLIAGGTYLENFVLGTAGIGGAPAWFLGGINGVQAAWVLIVVATMRLCGYGFESGRSTQSLTAPANTNGLAVR